MSDDPLVLRDEKGVKLTSIFHKPPKKILAKVNFWDWFAQIPMKFTIVYYHPDDFKEDK